MYILVWHVLHHGLLFELILHPDNISPSSQNGTVSMNNSPCNHYNPNPNQEIAGNYNGSHGTALNITNIRYHPFPLYQQSHHAQLNYFNGSTSPVALQPEGSVIMEYGHSFLDI